MGILAIFNKKTDKERDFIPEAIVGKRCTVTERIDTFAGCGEVKINGQYWSARGAYDDDCFEIGQTLKVVAIEGVRLICMKN